MHEKTRKIVTGVAALAAAGGITAGIAGAAKNGGKQRGTPPAGEPFGYGYGGGPRDDQEALTGDAKAKAEAAALDAVPGGTVVRSESGGHDGAAYHVHMTDADGKPVLVLLDKDFKVTQKLTGPPQGGPGGHFGPGGPGDRGPDGQDALTGDAKTKAEAAALAAVPGGKVERAESGGPNGAAYHVHVTDADGKPLVVLLDKDFNVTGKLTPPAGGPGGPRGPMPAPLTGDAADQAKAAALAVVKNGTVRAAFAAPEGADGAYVVFVERASGPPVVVVLDKDFKVVRKLSRPRFGGRDRHHGGPPPGAGYAPGPPETTTT